MDILQPQLVWVDGRCYRFCDSSAWTQGKHLEAYQEETYEPDSELNDEEACDNASIEIEPTRGNRFKHSFYVNSNFFGFIIGAKGATLKRLSTDTRTIILVPKVGQNGNIVITGANRRDIVLARHRIDLIIETSRSKLRFTHFLSIPANTDEIRENFNKFKENILTTSSTGAREIREELFQSPERLHLTIIMLVLLDEVERTKATEALEFCKESIIMPTLEKSGPLSIEFRGVECMNDDPSEVSILYIEAHERSGYLQKISDEIANYYMNQGLSRRQYEKVKLHMTAMNTKFLEKHTPEFKNIHRQDKTFDAKNILKEHENTYFGQINFSTIHLSLRHSRSKDGYYQVTAKIEF